MKSYASMALRASFVASALACGTAFAAAPVIAQVTPAMANYGAGRDAFAIGTDGHVREVGFVNNAYVTRDLTAELGAMPAVYGSNLSSINAVETPFSLIYTSADGHVHKMSRNLMTQAWSYMDLTAHATVAAGGTGSVVPAAPRTQITSIGLLAGHYRIYYVDVNNHIQELADANNGGWVTTDLSAATHSNGAVAGTALTVIDHRESSGFSCTGNCGLPGSPAAANTTEYPRVYYFDTTQHLQELAWGGDGAWHVTDISTSSGAAKLGVSGSALTSFDYDGGADALGHHSYYPRVYYFDVSGHVWEMAWASGWHSADISAQANAAPAVSGSALAGLAWNGGNDPKAYYVSYDGHVRELQWWHGGWIQNDLSPLVCVGGVAPGSALVSYYSNVQQDNFPSGVTFFTADNHIHQLKQTQSSPWVQIDFNGAGTEQGCTSSGGGGGGGGGGTRPVARY